MKLSYHGIKGKILTWINNNFCLGIKVRGKVTIFHLLKRDQ